MDEPISAPGGGAPASTGGEGGGSSAPVSTPSSSTAAPVSSPATATEPTKPVEAAPAADATPVRKVGETDLSYIERYREWREQQGKPTGEGVAQPTKADETVKPAEAAKPGEPARPAEAAKPAEAATPEKNPLDDVGPLPASKVAEALKANPALEAELEKAGIDKEELFTSLREAATATQFRELFTDLETAQFARTAAETFQRMDLAATELKAGDLASTQQFIQDVLMPMSYILDDTGKPKMREVKRADGSVLQVPETDGTVQTFMDNIRDVAMEQVVADANYLLGQNNDRAKELGERLLAAANEIQEFIKGVDLNSDGVSDEVKAERARLDADRAAFAETKRQEADQRFETFRNDVLSTTNDLVDGMVNEFLSKTSLADDPNDSAQAKESKKFIRDGVLREIRDGLYNRFNSNPLFRAEMEQIGRRGQTPAVKQALVNLYKRQANAAMEKVAVPVLQKAGAVRVQKSKAIAAKVAAQTNASQHEPRNATSPSIPTAPKVDHNALAGEARKQLMSELRRMPTAKEVIERTRALIAKAGQAVSA